MESSTKTSVNLRRFSRDDLARSFAHVNWDPRGKVCDVVGTVIEAFLPGSQLGTIVGIAIGGHQGEVLGEVVGFRGDRALILPYNNMAGIAPGCTVSAIHRLDQVLVGDHLIGKVLDPMLHPLTGKLNPADTERSGIVGI